MDLLTRPEIVKINIDSFTPKPAGITETKIDEQEEDPEDSGNAESELAETPNVESPDSEEDK